MTTLALAIGLIMANLVKPGNGVVLPVGEDTSAVQSLADTESTSITWANEMFLIIPESFFKAAVDNKVLAIVFCAVMFACSMMKADKESKKVMLKINEALSQVHKIRIMLHKKKSLILLKYIHYRSCSNLLA